METITALWTAFPAAGRYGWDTASVRTHWARLHAGDAEPLPQDDAVLHAWALYHRGEFHKATEAGLRAGGAGVVAANKATAIYANYLEPSEARRLELLLEVAERARAQSARDPRNPSGWYWQAYALGRYAQSISIAKALAQGLGSRVKEALETVIRLEPRHADAHFALGTFHAEVIDKVGALIAGMTYGAKKETGLALFRQGLRLNPHSAIGIVEYANGLLMLEGDRMGAEATRLYRQAAAMQPVDAMEHLNVEMARLALRD